MGLEIDPEREITVTCGSTEAMIASLLHEAQSGSKYVRFCFCKRDSTLQRAGRESAEADPKSIMHG